MNLATKASSSLPWRGGTAISGYAMAALLVAMSVMAVLLSAALPTWSHMVRREKEEELIFRGQQYARAINLYQRQYANASPPSIDVLIEQRMLRKKFKDPLSPNEDGEFQLLYVNTESPAAGSRGQGAASSVGTRPGGGIIGVASKNTGESIRIYEGKTRYNEWQFLGMQQSTQAGPPQGGGQRGAGPQRGGRGDGRGGGLQPGGAGAGRGGPGGVVGRQ